MLNNDLYEALIKLGLPRLPEDHFYKFYVNDYEPHGSFGPKHKNTLHADIRKKVFFGLFWKHIRGYYQTDEILTDKYDVDREKMIENGYVTRAELDSTRDWLPQHLVYLGAETYYAWTKHKQAEEARIAKEKESRTSKVDQFLNKRLP